MTPLHYDLCHGFLAQMYGRKRFILASHEDLPLLYLNKDPSIGNRNISRVDVAQWVDDTSDQRAKYPNFGDTTLYVADLFPGDILYTPPGWFHHVTSIDCSMYVLMPFDPQPDEQLPVVFSM
jgi:ribosomal protein L16 Arg81 hydroxylase